MSAIAASVRGSWPTFGSAAQGALLAMRRGWWRMTVLLAIVAALSSVLVVLATPLLGLSAAVGPKPTDGASATIAATYSVILASILNWLVTAPALVLGPATAIVVAADVLGDRELSLRGELGQVVRRAPAAFGAFLLVFAALVGSVLLTTPLIYFAFFLAPAGMLLLILYAAVRALHRPAVLWVALALIPFALVTYLTVRLSLALVAVVADGAGPLEGLRRSLALTDGRWLEVLVLIGIGAAAAAIIDVVVVSGAIGLAGIDVTSPGISGTLAQGAWIVGSAFVAGIPFALVTAYYVTLSGGVASPSRAVRRRERRRR